jgi:4-hydroxybenzoate polyprenyltransferase
VQTHERSIHAVPRVKIVSSSDFFALGPQEMAAFVRGDGRVLAGRLERLKILIMLGRPRTCAPGVLAYALGYSYTGAPFSHRMVLGALLAFGIGVSANLHNTSTDLDEDSRNLPGRVLLLAKLGQRPLLASTSLLAVSMMLGAIALGTYFAVFMALALAGLHQYSAPPVRSKGRPILGLWVFAQAVVFPFLFGWTTAPGRMLQTLLLAMFAPLTGAPRPPPIEATQSFRYLAMWAFLTFWFMAKGLFKNVPDFAGDRAAGVRTSATVCGSRRTAALVAAWATVVAYGLIGVPVALGLEDPRVLLALVWIVPVGWNAVRLVRASDAAKANKVLKADMLLSIGFIGTLLLLVAPRHESLVVAIVAAVVLFGSDLLGLDSRRQSDALARRAFSS